MLGLGITLEARDKARGLGIRLGLWIRLGLGIRLGARDKARG